MCKTCGYPIELVELHSCYDYLASASRAGDDVSDEILRLQEKQLEYIHSQEHLVRIGERVLGAIEYCESKDDPECTRRFVDLLRLFVA